MSSRKRSGDLIRTALGVLPEGDEALRIDNGLTDVVSNVWNGRTILLSPNLGVEQVLDSVKVSIKRAGGVLD